MKLNVLTGLPVNTLADLSSGLSKKNQRGRDYSARHVAVRSVALILIAYYAIAMSAQSVTIEVAPQVATILEKLKARAEAQGVTLDALLRKLLPISEISDEQVEMTNSKLTGNRVRWKRRSLLAGVLFFLGIGVAVLQPGWTQPAMTQEQTVTLDVAVVERDANAFGSLTKDEFTVYEDGVKQPIISLTAQDSPFSLGIAIDASGSMREQLPLIQKTALDVISQMGSADEAFVVAFTTESELMQDFTSNQRDLANAVGQIGANDGGTALLDNVVAAANYVNQKGKHRRKALLFITGGVDKSSSIIEDKVVTRLIENQAQSYFVCLPVQVSRAFFGVKSSLKPREQLDRLARATGGQSYYLGDALGSASTAARFIGSLRSQYEITYAPTNSKQDGKLRKVRVVVSPNDKRQLNVVTRQGYYGPGHEIKR